MNLLADSVHPTLNLHTLITMLFAVSNLCFRRCRQAFIFFDDNILRLLEIFGLLDCLLFFSLPLVFDKII